MNASIEPETILVGSLKEDASLSGSIIFDGTLSGSIESLYTLLGSVSMPETFEKFSGDYRVIPAIESKVVPTKDKLMEDDVIVEQIPYYEVSNPQGGSTIVIGDDSNAYGKE